MCSSNIHFHSWITITTVLGPWIHRVSKHRVAALVSVHSLVRGLTLLQRSSLPLMLILLANDVEINPGPVCSQNSSLNCIGMNARSLKSLHNMNGHQTCNLSRF